MDSSRSSSGSNITESSSSFPPLLLLVCFVLIRGLACFCLFICSRHKPHRQRDNITHLFLNIFRSIHPTRSRVGKSWRFLTEIRSKSDRKISMFFGKLKSISEEGIFYFPTLGGRSSLNKIGICCFFNRFSGLITRNRLRQKFPIPDGSCIF